MTNLPPHTHKRTKCATQAILSVVLNAGLKPEELGKTLAEFHSFTQSFPPQLKGEAIASSDDIRKAHNAFSRKDAFLAEGRFHIPTGDEDVYHFVSKRVFNAWIQIQKYQVSVVTDAVVLAFSKTRSFFLKFYRSLMSPAMEQCMSWMAFRRAPFLVCFLRL